MNYCKTDELSDNFTTPVGGYTSSSLKIVSYEFWLEFCMFYLGNLRMQVGLVARMNHSNKGERMLLAIGWCTAAGLWHWLFNVISNAMTVSCKLKVALLTVVLTLVGFSSVSATVGSGMQYRLAHILSITDRPVSLLEKRSDEFV